MTGLILTNASAIDRSKTDFYPTPNEVTQALLNFLNIEEGATIWEPACGDGKMAKVLLSNGKYNIVASDLYDMGYGTAGIDFLSATKPKGLDWIITNPPFAISEDFIRKCFDHNCNFAMLLKSQYWHSKKRFDLFEMRKPKYVLPLTWRPDFLSGAKGGAPTMEVLWTVWGTDNAQTTQYVPLLKPKSINSI